MKMTVTTLCLIAFAMAAHPAAALAGDREGFYLGFGGGWGSAKVESDQGSSTDRESSGVGYIKAGGALNRHLLFGGELNAWRKTATIDTNTEATLKMYNLAATLTYYPGATNGFFIKGGAGVALLGSEFTVPGAKLQLDMGNGLGVIAGLGYDIPLGGNVSITPALNVWRGDIGDLTVGSQTRFTNWTQNVVDLTIGIVFH